MKEIYTVTIDNGITKWKNPEGKLHNPHGPAVECLDGNKEYWIEGKRHNENGPAFFGADGYKAYWLNGQRHNENGPAREWANGYKEYYIEGKELTEEQFNNRNKLSGKEVSVKIDGVTYNAIIT